MKENTTSCIRCVDAKNLMVKNGKSRSGKQRYICKNCKRTPPLPRESFRVV